MIITFFILQNKNLFYCTVGWGNEASCRRSFSFLSNINFCSVFNTIPMFMFASISFLLLLFFYHHHYHFFKKPCYKVTFEEFLRYTCLNVTHQTRKDFFFLLSLLVYELNNVKEETIMVG